MRLEIFPSRPSEAILDKLSQQGTIVIEQGESPEFFEIPFCGNARIVLSDKEQSVRMMIQLPTARGRILLTALVDAEAATAIRQSLLGYSTTGISGLTSPAQPRLGQSDDC